LGLCLLDQAQVLRSIESECSHALDHPFSFDGGHCVMMLAACQKIKDR